MLPLLFRRHGEGGRITRVGSVVDDLRVPAGRPIARGEARGSGIVLVAMLLSRHLRVGPLPLFATLMMMLLLRLVD